MNISIDSRVNGREARVHAGLMVTAALCGIALSCVAAAGDPFSEPRTKVINYADLNLSSEAGAATMYGRLRAAARNVCKPLDSGVFKKEWRACFDQTIARAIVQVDEPVLTAYHNARTDKSDTRLVIAKQQ